MNQIHNSRYILVPVVFGVCEPRVSWNGNECKCNACKKN